MQQQKKKQWRTFIYSRFPPTGGQHATFFTRSRVRIRTSCVPNPAAKSLHATTTAAAVVQRWCENPTVQTGPVIFLWAGCCSTRIHACIRVALLCGLAVRIYEYLLCLWLCTSYQRYNGNSFLPVFFYVYVYVYVLICRRKIKKKNRRIYSKTKKTCHGKSKSGKVNPVGGRRTEFF